MTDGARLLLFAAALAGVVGARAEETLSFSVVEGAVENRLYRDGQVAAHALTTAGEHPRLVVAFPAGNTGIGLWFGRPAPRFRMTGPLAPVERTDGMRGVSARIEAEAAELPIAKAILGNVNTVREWVPPGLTFPPIANRVEAGPPARISRVEVDGRHRIEISLVPEQGATAVMRGDALVLAAAPGRKRIRFRFEAVTDEEPLTPIPSAELLKDSRGADPALLRALAFLSYREKLLAGSWRFLTYFGRDTLLSVRLLMPAMRPDLAEAGIGSVLERLAPDGDVGHYELIADFAALVHTARKDPPADLRKPDYGYLMIDDDFLLAPVLAEYLATPEGSRRGADFLARKTSAGEAYAKALRKNLDRVLAKAAPYASTPTWSNLIALQDGLKWGEWRDSDDGLGGGRFPFDVNAALVPAALEAAGALLRRPELRDDHAAAEADRLAAAWRTAPTHFHVDLPGAEARRRAAEYQARLGLKDDAAARIGDTLPLEAIALDSAGVPVPIQHSDDGFMLLFRKPPAKYLEEAADRILLPFPAGLRTPVGVVVANPAYASRALQDRFTPAQYHGTVVWSWQQAMLAAGLARQLERSDLAASTREKLKAAQSALWDVIDATRAQGAGELWSFDVREGKIALAPFGQGAGHVDESNAAQLWSTVYLAIKRPGR